MKDKSYVKLMEAHWLKIFIALATLSIFIQAFRIPVNVIGPGLDQSFPHILNLFSFDSSRFGSDLIYTYGPLGFLLVVENINNNLATGMSFWTVAYLIFSITIAYFIVSMTSGWQMIASFLLAILVADLGFAGTPAADALAFSVSFGISQMFVGLPGLVLAVMSKYRRNNLMPVPINHSIK